MRGNKNLDEMKRKLKLYESGVQREEGGFSYCTREEVGFGEECKFFFCILTFLCILSNFLS